jgi:hypothetical protein
MANPSFVVSHMAERANQVRVGSVEACTRKSCICLGAVAYLLFAIMAFAMGLFAFVWKIVELSYLYKTTIGFGRIELWVNILGFLNQALQIVDVEDARQDRLFLFIFGGEDVVLQPQEMERRNAYLARLMNVIYEVYGEDMKRPMLAVSLMVTFNHEDLQRLVIYRDDDSEFAQRQSMYHQHLRLVITET